jgi:hypothetical protein
MLEDMQIRNYSPHTIDGYLRYVAQFAKHFGTSPDRLGPEHIRTYQLHLLQQQVSESIFIQTVCALRFLYETTLHRSWMVDYIPYPKKALQEGTCDETPFEVWRFPFSIRNWHFVAKMAREVVPFGP